MAPITWNYKTMSDYITEFENFYNKSKSEENYILGFSYGAVIAFSTAEKLHPRKLFLCSLSSDFKEDVASMSDTIKRYIGEKRVADCLTRSGKEIAKKLTVPTLVFCGEKEGRAYPQLKKRCEETVQLASNAKLIIVKDSPHDIAYPEYVMAIKGVI
jgi:pimeloyl-ACP methyl ester carboxylesterase